MVAYPGTLEPFNDHPSAHGHLIGLRKKPPENYKKNITSGIHIDCQCIGVHSYCMVIKSLLMVCNLDWFSRMPWLASEVSH